MIQESLETTIIGTRVPKNIYKKYNFITKGSSKDFFFFLKIPQKSMQTNSLKFPRLRD